MASDLHLPNAMPLGEAEFAAGGLFRLLRNALGDANLASDITAAIERVIDAKIAAHREFDKDRKSILPDFFDVT
ncbi:hypothetical protein [Microvirga puerhi]|uniref:Uncharacterized protein n=1 Tax=Microvirga puerhi TaxID=2876078 RepID=A0ABS7VGS0_9HYPH|nr:hypothetical protein [Microvirga puerhi]MBZ6074696.1 hypothetical protein [Microvirga puerhi]